MGLPHGIARFDPGVGVGEQVALLEVEPELDDVDVEETVGVIVVGLPTGRT